MPRELHGLPSEARRVEPQFRGREFGELAVVPPAVEGDVVAPSPQVEEGYHVVVSPPALHWALGAPDHLKAFTVELKTEVVAPEVGPIGQGSRHP